MTIAMEYSFGKSVELIMKYLAWALIIIGLAAILFGVESSRRDNEVSIRSPVTQPNTNTEGDPKAIASAEKFIRVTGGGIIIFFKGLYLRNRRKIKK
jgi:hypothetical protein